MRAKDQEGNDTRCAFFHTLISSVCTARENTTGRVVLPKWGYIPLPPPKEVGCSQLGEYKGGSQLFIQPNRRDQKAVEAKSWGSKVTAYHKANLVSTKEVANILRGQLGEYKRGNQLTPEKSGG